MSRLGVAASQGRETLDGVRREISLTRQEGALHRPAPPEAGLVLDVGSGPAADPRADVVVDKDLFDVAARAGASSTTPARPLVVADAQHLPFADGAFAYVIAVEVLAQTKDPARAAAELARVAPTGFVQVPSRAAELVYGGPMHRWLIDLDGTTLRCFPKEEEPPGAAEARAAYEESLLVRLGWSAHRSRWVHSVEWAGTPRVEVHGEGADAPSTAFDVERVLAHLAEENRRGALAFMPPAVLDLLRCPADGGRLGRRGRWMDCASCGTSYPVVGPVPLLLAEAAQVAAPA